jgi:two-component system sensor histidine kinase KdpD
MTEDRPDPDALLEQIRSDEARARRGKLRIYFGSSAGVGKTYAMLLGARKLQAEGHEVVAGVIETHGRGETAALLDGLEVLPLARVEYRRHQLTEFDLDGALQRRPEFILVDELAHSNVAGSRHPKRWQDVEELLAAGIHVYSTLNVQHLESLNDVVGGITGIRVYETLPDTFFDRADEVVLVDTPAEELLARLKAGKVYLPAQAERAATHFFRKGNLMALRELALRRTADRVEDDVQAYRSDQAIERVWQTEAALLCCVGPQPGDEAVVRSAARLARQLGVSWHAVYIETPVLQRLPDAQRERILRTVALAQELGATTAVLSGQSEASVLVEHARRHNLSKLVVGRHPPRTALQWLLRRGWRAVGRSVARLAPDIDLIEVGRISHAAERSNEPAAEQQAETPSTNHLRYLWAALSCAGMTLAALPLVRAIDLANIVMLFLLTEVVVAVRWGRGPAVLAAFMCVAAFDFFFVPPRLSFAVSDVQYLITFLVMLGVGLFTGQITAGLRYQARVAMRREARSHVLYQVARDLSQLLLTDDVMHTASQAISREFKARVLILLLDRHERLQAPQQAPSHAESHAGPDWDIGTAQWALDHNQAAGLGTDTLPGSAWLYLPLKATVRTRGVLAIQPSDPRMLMVPEQRQQLDTFAALVAMALERVHFVDVAQEASVHIESERLRNSLLAALSHDLRTPLSVLVGLADTLSLMQPLTAQQSEIAASMREESLRMSKMVSNLLDMARIQSGDIQLRRDWQSVEELVGSSLAATRNVLGARDVQVRLAPELPLVECDAALIVRVLVNLLENAAKYTPAGSPLRLSARVDGAELLVALADHGPGVPPDQLEAIFDKFTRVDAESATPGVGLGLAICRAIVQAHRGRIWADNLPAGGAVFTFTLPLREPPPIEPEPELETAPASDDHVRPHA